VVVIAEARNAAVVDVGLVHGERQSVRARDDPENGVARQQLDAIIRSWRDRRPSVVFQADEARVVLVGGNRAQVCVL